MVSDISVCAEKNGSINVVSRNYNPGHFSHLRANCLLLKEAGYHARLYCDEAFDFLNEESGAEFEVVHDFESIDFDSVTHFIVWFPSLSVLYDMVRLRLKHKNVKIIYVFHEPFESLGAYLKAGFGTVKTIKICLTAIVNYMLAYLSHGLILPSAKAFSTFATWRLSKKKVVVELPLMFDDEAARFDDKEVGREYFSYIGTIAADHAFDQFVNFITSVELGQELDGMKFLIATKNNLDEGVVTRLKPLIDSGVLRLVCGKPMSNAEINSYYAKSVCVWNAYYRSMQSGVLPKAFMFGTPVLVSSKNQNEFVCVGSNALSISSAYETVEIKSSIVEIFRDFRVYSENSRASFEKFFYYKSQSKRFVSFMSRL